MRGGREWGWPRDALCFESDYVYSTKGKEEAKPGKATADLFYELLKNHHQKKNKPQSIRWFGFWALLLALASFIGRVQIPARHRSESFLVTALLDGLFGAYSYTQT